MSEHQWEDLANHEQGMKVNQFLKEHQATVKAVTASVDSKITIEYAVPAERIPGNDPGASGEERYVITYGPRGGILNTWSTVDERRKQRHRAQRRRMRH